VNINTDEHSVHQIATITGWKNTHHIKTALKNFFARIIKQTAAFKKMTKKTASTV